MLAPTFTKPLKTASSMLLWNQLLTSVPPHLQEEACGAVRVVAGFRAPPQAVPELQEQGKRGHLPHLRQSCWHVLGSGAWWECKRPPAGAGGGTAYPSGLVAVALFWIPPPLHCSFRLDCCRSWTQVLGARHPPQLRRHSNCWQKPTKRSTW